MPFFLIILGQKIGLDLAAATAPQHIFVKYRDDLGTVFNVEATSGGLILDSSFRKQFPMTDKAITNGLYMRPLSKKEMVALMADTLLEFYAQEGRESQVVALAELELKYNPRYAEAMIHISASSERLWKRDIYDKYKRSDDIPPDKWEYCLRLEKDMKQWGEKAEALGWREPDQASEDRYKQRIEQLKLNH
jgi:hypothetical protein